MNRVDAICIDRAELQCAIDAAMEACALADCGAMPRCEATMQTALARMYLQKYIDGLNMVLLQLQVVEQKNVEKWQNSFFPEKKELTKKFFRVIMYED